jgi:hypothetical protein
MKTNGFRVIVGTKKGSGFFNYIKGTKKEAQKLGEKMKLIFPQENQIIDLQAVNLKKCDMKECDNLCESNVIYCLKCEDLLFDAQAEARERKEEIEIEV